MYRDYAPKGVKFYFVYKALAHPELNGYVQPFTHDERLRHAREAERRLGSSIPWLVDAFDNRLKHALGDRPNSEFVIDPDGKIVRERAWSSPSALREDLAKLVGLVEKPTPASEIKLKVIPPPKAVATGVVPRVPRPRGASPLRIEPEVKQGGSPFYAKLRAEADADLIGKGKGKLYLGFHLDPLYLVHWNNLAGELSFELKAPDGVTLSKTAGQAPKVTVPSDGDPREFLIDVSEWPADKPIRLTVSYAVCSDDRCFAAKQHYVIHRKADPDGGRAMTGSRRPGRPGPKD